MFGSKKQSEFDVDSSIGKNTKIYGNIVFSGGLHIDGVVVGNVVAESEGSNLNLSERGRIEGNVSVHNIQLNGEVVGDVHAIKQIELATNARVKGNVYYNVIEMAKGAEVNGSLIHGEPARREEPVFVANQQPVVEENFQPVSEPVAPPMPSSQAVNSQGANSTQTYAQPPTANHAVNTAPAVFPAHVVEQQRPTALPAENPSMSHEQVVGHMKIANQGGK